MQKCSKFKLFLSYLKDHISKHDVVSCPFAYCSKRFKNVTISSFSSHICGYLKCANLSNVNPNYILANNDMSENITNGIVAIVADGETNLVCSTSVDSDCEIEFPYVARSEDLSSLMLQKLSLFSLSLQVKHHVPLSIIQNIIDEFSSLIRENMSIVGDTVSNAISDMPAHQQELILNCVHSFPLRTAVDSKGPLRSDHMRIEHYKDSLNYIDKISVPFCPEVKRLALFNMYLF